MWIAGIILKKTLAKDWKRSSSKIG